MWGKFCLGFLFSLVIILAALGNLLILISTIRVAYLRENVTNYFIMSLAVADFLLAILVMPFNASLVLNDRQWVFPTILCDLFNANDVMFCTASIITLCYISLERYIGVTQPLVYMHILTSCRVIMMICLCWTLSFLVSHVLIHSKIFISDYGIQVMANSTDICEFFVNRAYGIGSSILSFWIPCFIMLVVYYKIYVEARKQQIKLIKHRDLFATIAQNTTPSSKFVLLPSLSRQRVPSSRVSIDTTVTQAFQTDVSNTPCSRSLSNNKLSATLFPRVSQRLSATQRVLREHKAAKTLAVILGCFIACWLPFFLWMTGSNICGSLCAPLPTWAIDVLFWIGYFNSSLNPLIYAFYMKDYRRAILQVLGLKSWWQKKQLRQPSAYVSRQNYS